MPSRFWRGCRIGLRWCRISGLLLILAAACGLFYLDHVDLPDFLKQPLLASLKERGIVVEFARMRLRLTRGIVVEKVSLGAAGSPDSPTLTLAEVQLSPDFLRLLHGHLEVQGLAVRDGRLVMPVAGAGPGPGALELTNIQADVRFQTNDTWSVDNFQAVFNGATLALSGDIRHATELGHWEMFQGRKSATPANWQVRLRTLSEITGKIKLEGAPRLTLNITGDARDVNSFAVRVKVTAPAARTPWFSAHELVFNASLSALAGLPTNALLPGVWTNLQPYRLAWNTHFTRMRAENFSAESVTARGFWRAPEMDLDLELQNASQRAHPPWFGVESLQFSAQLTAPAVLATNPPLPGLWSNLPPGDITWSTRVTRLNSDPLKVDSAAAGGAWQAPELSVTNLTLHLGGGWLRAAARFDAARQTLDFTNASVFDPQAVAALLPAMVRERLGWFTWSQPPALHLAGSADLSAWPARTNVPVAVTGGLAFTNATVSGVDLDWLQTDFSYSNQVWQVAGLQVARQSTRLQLAGSEDENTKHFNLQVKGAFDVNQIRPWLKTKGAIREVGRLTFHDPLVLDLTVHGELHQVETLAATGRLALTNFAARGGSVDSLTTGVTYSNRVIQFVQPHAERVHGTQVLGADAITLDLNELRIYFTNGYSTAEPQVIANAIGPKTGRTLEPYQFLTPPTARVNGFVSLRSSEDNQEMEMEDLRVDILKGAPFRWGRFNSQRVEGTARWFGPTLLLTNLDTEFYRGNANGWAAFDFRPASGTDFSFAFDITNANLHGLMADLNSPTNQLEGIVSGRLVVTSGNSTNWQGMSGYGQATLQDGLIWDAPMFGILSPVLNQLSPGLGRSRATDATGQFTMTNGVIYSDNLVIHSTMMRLSYTGTVDLHENLNARAATQLLRDTPGLGALLHVITWPVTKLFEYKVTGTLADPKMEPLNDLAKILLAPLRPLKTLENLLPGPGTNTATVFTNTPGRK